MNVTFYKCSNDLKEYPKTLVDGISFNCELIEPVNTKNPTLKVAYNSALLNYQYAVINDLNMSYIINSGATIRNGFLYMSLSADPLHHFWSVVSGCNAHIVRSADSNEKYIVDNMATQTTKTELNVENLGRAFTKGNSYILIKGVTNYKIIDEG